MNQKVGEHLQWTRYWLIREILQPVWPILDKMQVNHNKLLRKDLQEIIQILELEVVQLGRLYKVHPNHKWTLLLMRLDSELLEDK